MYIYIYTYESVSFSNQQLEIGIKEKYMPENFVISFLTNKILFLIKSMCQKIILEIYVIGAYTLSDS